MVLDPWPLRRGRRQPQRLKALAALQEANPAAALAALLSGASDGVDVDRFNLARNLSAASAAELWRASGAVRVETRVGQFGFAARNWQALAENIAATLAAHHDEVPESPGIEPHRLRLALAPRMPADVFAAAIAATERDLRVRHDGRWLKLAGHAASRQRLWGAGSGR